MAGQQRCGILVPADDCVQEYVIYR